MNSWLVDEEMIISKESHRKDLKGPVSVKFIVFMVFFIAVIFAQYLKATEFVQCPCCNTILELEMDINSIDICCTSSGVYGDEVIKPEVRECPGAGWFCDKCGQFQCHGQKCVFCKAPRKKR